MSSLKEIRGRINSISTTLKITDVTRMIAGAKLHKTQTILTRFKAYEYKIESIFGRFAANETTIASPYIAKRKIKHLAVVVISSNSSLCGAFNSNIIKKAKSILCQYTSLAQEISVYALGKKIYEALNTTDETLKFTLKDAHADWVDHPSYENMTSLADQLMDQFARQQLDAVLIIGSKSKNILTQIPSEIFLLPFVPQNTPEAIGLHSSTDYLVEPNKAELLTALIPQLIRLRLFQVLLETKAAEFAARSAAMQTATDNANKLIGELTKQYNRVRQAAITREIIDIVGGAEALR